MNHVLEEPIGILDEHPDWSARLTAELTRRALPWERIDHSNHAFDPRDRGPAYSVIVNRTSPSSHTRGHAGVLFYAEPLLAHAESLGIPVVNPVTAYRFEKSKALQLGLFEQLGVRYPRALVVNHRDQVLKALDRVRFPLVVKPNVGGSGAGIVRFAAREELVDRLHTLDFGPDGTALVQEYIESEEDAVVRVEVLDGEYLYAIRIVRSAESAGFNLCPADICRTPAAPAASDLGACPVEAKPGLSVSRVDAPSEAIDTVIRLTRAASIDVGGVEYLVGKTDGNIYYYDVNATSNFVASAPAVVGFDPTARFVDYIVRVAQRGAKQLAA
ncbi:MAG: ATP-grasp domain-containing protein [Candidatus Rokuibacteriota bacterium]